MCKVVEIATSLSHLKAIYTAYTNKEKYAIIMEDDAIMLRNFDWDKLVNLAPNNWEILQLHTTCIPGTTFFYHPVYKYRHNNNLWIKKDHFIASCACYIVSKEGMEKLISRYLKDINNFTIDNYFNKYNTIDWKHIKTQCQADSLVYFQLNKYICTQILIDVENLDSDIRDMNHEWSTCHRYSKNFIKEIPQELIGLDEPKQIDVEVRFLRPFKGVAKTPFKIDALTATQSRVTWGMSSSMTYPMNAMMFFMNFDKILGNDIEVSLKKLKGILEK